MNTPKVAEHIINWLKDYATNAKVNGFVVGISGGIDSAVTSTLCAKTGLPTLCVELPIHQAKSHVSRANEHIKLLKERFSNVSEAEVNLTSTFENFKTVVPQVEPSAKVDLALANTRARLRMTTLYYFAGLHGLLVAGTGNKGRASGQRDFRGDQSPGRGNRWCLLPLCPRPQETPGQLPAYRPRPSITDSYRPERPPRLRSGAPLGQALAGYLRGVRGGCGASPCGRRRRSLCDLRIRGQPGRVCTDPARGARVHAGYRHHGGADCRAHGRQAQGGVRDRHHPGEGL